MKAFRGGAALTLTNPISNANHRFLESLDLPAEPGPLSTSFRLANLTETVLRLPRAHLLPLPIDTDLRD